MILPAIPAIGYVTVRCVGSSFAKSEPVGEMLSAQSGAPKAQIPRERVATYGGGGGS